MASTLSPRMVRIKVGSNLSSLQKAPTNPDRPPKAVPGGQRIKPREGQRSYGKNQGQVGPSDMPYAPGYWGTMLAGRE